MIVLKPKEPVMLWINNHISIISSPGEKEEVNLPDLEIDSTIYLMPEHISSMEDCLKFIQTNDVNLFNHELGRFFTDEKMWPENRTFDLLSQWFEFKVYTRLIK